eukprot:SAG22_NODE_1434_length_4427_cov_2.505776_2_plen_174_part_00
MFFLLLLDCAAAPPPGKRVEINWKGTEVKSAAEGGMPAYPPGSVENPLYCVLGYRLGQPLLVLTQHPNLAGPEHRVSWEGRHTISLPETDVRRICTAVDDGGTAGATIHELRTQEDAILGVWLPMCVVADADGYEIALVSSAVVAAAAAKEDGVGPDWDMRSNGWKGRNLGGV